jgi:hypothetical protein
MIEAHRWTNHMVKSMKSTRNWPCSDIKKQKIEYVEAIWRAALKRNL